METQQVFTSVMIFLTVFITCDSISSENEENPEEVGGNFEGDMIMSETQLRDLHYGPRNGRLSKASRWPKKDGIVTVPYRFDSDSDYCKFCNWIII